ncbi:DinB family protein [Ancylobacter sp. IITR112]|uniref:DinB family protein n=1 Tax=Ancylobacter sp. IITR112 TaxID=3138073 RepID=UPI00352B7BB5
MSTFPAPGLGLETLVTERYRGFAAYNEWANARLYAAAGRLSEAQYRADGGAFFGSVHGTLNHLLVADRLWLRRLTGNGPEPAALDAILFETLDELAQARIAEDARLTAYIAGLDAATLAADHSYANVAGTRFTQTLATILDHVFNHQTHHRGQVHCLVSGLLGKDAAPSLDLIAFQRESGVSRQG